MKDPAKQEKNLIRELFSEELFYNVKIREYIIGGVFAILVLFMIISLFIFRDVGPDPETVRNTFLGLLVLLIAIVLRSFSVRKIIERKKKQVKKNIIRLRYVNTVLESSIPTIAIILLTFFLEPIAAVNSPAVFLYFIFIFISILDLEFKVCALAGLIAAIQYLFLSLFFLDSYKEATDLPVFVLPIAYLAKAIIIFVSGLAAGGVAYHIKNKIVGSLKTFRERNELEKVFGQQVSKEIVDEFINNKLEISSKRRNVTVLFLDIRNFSKFCEGKTPEEINEYQNKVLGFMIEEINNNAGIVNQILGDGFMATFGAPVENENHALNSVNAALQIVNELNRKNENGEIPKTDIGIGIHTGEVFTGNVGTEDRQQYSITGNTVILAARLEQLNKEFNSSILVSKEVIEKIEYIEYKYLGKATLKGLAGQAEVYELL